MSQFLILDPGYTGSVGPRGWYLRACLRGAAQAGMQVHVAVHRRWTSEKGAADSEFLRSAQGNVAALFAEGVEEDEAWDLVAPAAVGQAPTRAGSQDFPGAVGHAWGSSGLRTGVPHQATTFFQGCLRWLDEVGLERGDQVFVPFATPFHFLGLCKFLHHCGTTRSAQWHIQFPADLEHLSLTESGSPAGSPRAWWPVFAKALGLAHDRNLSLWTPTAALTAQYNELGIAQFETLPMYAGHELPVSARRGIHGPLKLLCLGNWSCDWSRQQLSRIALDLWHDHLATRQVELYVLPGSNLERWLPASDWCDSSLSQDAPIKELMAPAAWDDYLRLLQETDVAVMLDEPRTLRHRLPGMLPDLVAAGMPLVAPRGTTVSEQLEELSRRANEVPPQMRRPWGVADGQGAGAAVRPAVNHTGHDPSRFSEVIRDMIEDYARYRREASHLAQAWRRLHSPRVTLRRLLSGRRFLWAAPAA